MRAHEPHLAPRRALTLVGLLALVACASNPPEPVQRAAAPQATPTADVPPAEPSPAAEESFAELEASLAMYEQQLASNEARLQAMGVRVAQRAGGAAEREAKNVEPAADDRFAPPPPALAGDASASRSDRKPSKTRAPTSGPNTEAAPAPAPRPESSAGGRAAGGLVGRAGSADEDKKKASEPPRDLNHCSELCDLAHSTCELEAKICDLAARHPGEPRYDAVCRRADEDCRLASEACTLCSP